MSWGFIVFGFRDLGCSGFAVERFRVTLSGPKAGSVWGLSPLIGGNVLLPIGSKLVPFCGL